MILILEGLLKGLVLWIYGLILDGVSYMANSLLDVFNMDLSYFERYAPVTGDIVRVIIATGWALLLGNLVFQAMRSMATGIGFEGEDPKILFTRTFVFSFLLVASRQICDMGLHMTSIIMDLMQIPDAVSITTPDETNFGAFDSAWLLVIIVGIILIWQIIKFFFEIGERYVILAVLTIMAPLAFGMGGSKNTEDIFKGWVRMYGSMCVMMLMNVVFLKLLLSAMSTVPSGIGIIPWLIFIVAIARVGRKVDDLVCRVGLNPARTGDPLGRGVPMMLTMMVARNIGKSIANTHSKNQGQKPSGASGGAAGSPSPRSGPTGPMGSGGNGGNTTSGSSQGGGTHTSSQSSAQNTATATQAAGAAGQHGAVGQQAATAAGHAAGQAMGHAAGQGGQVQRPSAGRSTSRQENRTGSQQTQGSRPGQRVEKGARPAGKPVNIDVECDEPQGQNGGGGAAPRPANINAAAPGAPNTAAKAAEPKPSRPPIQRTPRGNFPQAPVGAGVTPPVAHTTQTSSTGNIPGIPMSTAPKGRGTWGGGTDPSPRGAPRSRSSRRIDSSGQEPELSRTLRPPIGHNSVVNSTSQESHSTSSGRNAASPQSHAATAAPPSPGRNGTPQGAPPSGGRNTTTQSNPTVAPTVPPSPGRNGASAPQKPLPPTQGTDRTQSPAPSLGRNSAPQGASPESCRTAPEGRGTWGGGADPAPRGAPTSVAAKPRSAQSAGSEEQRHFGQDSKMPRTLRPPIGHNRKPPEVK